MKDLATVIEGMRRKDKGSFKMMVDHYASSLMTVAKFYAKNTHDAEDILQDSFIRIFLNIKTFDSTDEKMFHAWSKKIVVNTALAKYRRKYFTHEKYLPTSTEKSEAPTVSQKFDREDVMSFIYKLPLKYREVIGLYAIEGYSHAEIAEILKIKESSSRSMYSRAKTKLKKIMYTAKTLIC